MVFSSLEDDYFLPGGSTDGLIGGPDGDSTVGWDAGEFEAQVHEKRGEPDREMYRRIFDRQVSPVSDVRTQGINGKRK